MNKNKNKNNNIQSNRKKSKNKSQMYNRSQHRYKFDFFSILNYDFGRDTIFERILIGLMTVIFLLFVNNIANIYITHKTVEISNNVVTDTEFKIKLSKAIQELSKENNTQYVLDDRYYNEKNAALYVGILAEKKMDFITKNDIKDLFWDLFIPLNQNGVTNLILKDQETLMIECEDRIKMNALDYAFLGTSNDDIIKESHGVYISQNSPKFAKIPYGSSTVKDSGCGLVSLAMAINYVYGANTVSVDDVLQWAEENDMYEENAGTKWSLVRNFPKTVGVNCQEMYIDNIDKFKSALREGEVLVASMSEGYFTNKGHFIVITSITDGVASVLDPTSIYRSLIKWDAETILKESNNYFWKISKEE